MPMAERIRWFVYTIQSIEKPLEGKPNFNGQAMNEFVAQTVRWESYLEQLRGTAVWAGVPLEKAAELVGHALR